MKDVNELRRGSVISAHGFFSEVRSVLEDGDIISRPFLNKKTGLSEMIQGIELSKDILKKCGFSFPYKGAQKNKGHLSVGSTLEYVWSPEKGMTLKASAKFSTDEEIKFESIEGIAEFNCGCDYLHQFQNHHLYIAGRELEINL